MTAGLTCRGNPYPGERGFKAPVGKTTRSGSLVRTSRVLLQSKNPSWVLLDKVEDDSGVELFLLAQYTNFVEGESGHGHDLFRREEFFGLQ